MYFGFRNLSVNYGKKEVLRALNVDIPRGKVVTVIGQNGCGKSTLLKTVSKAVMPKRGEVIFCDKKLGEYAPKRLRAADCVSFSGTRVAARYRCAHTGFLRPVSLFKVWPRNDTARTRKSLIGRSH